MVVGPMSIEGVDYAWSRPGAAALAAAGKLFACRYGGPGSAGKQLDPAEARALSAAGVAIVANAEGAANGLLGGWSTGVTWARQAAAHFAACGMPWHRPVYLSVDFDVSSSQWPAVASALRGAASVLGAGRVGVYGGRRAIEWARRDGVAQWFWQTYAWSGGVWVPGNHIEQYRNGVPLGGATVDLDRALPSDFGQWRVGGDMEPTDRVGYPTNADRTYGQGWTDSFNYRDWDIGAGELVPGSSPGDWPRPGSPAWNLANLPELLGLHAAAAIDPAAIAVAVRAALTDPEVLEAIATAVSDRESRRPRP
jgi:hypothetical protein